MVVDTDTVQRTAAQHLWPPGRDWTQMAEEGGPDVIVGGHGVKVVDSTGKTWIDVNGGYSSVNVGYGRTEIAEAAYEQMKRLAFFPQRTTTEATVRLAEKVAELAPGALSRVFPVSGGSEAVETAIKIARAYHHRMGVKGRYKIVSRRGSYHGGTGATLWLGGGHVGREEYEPAPPGLIYVPQPIPVPVRAGGRERLGVRGKVRRGGREADTVPQPGHGGRLHRRAGRDAEGRGRPGRRVLADGQGDMHQVRRPADRR